LLEDYGLDGLDIDYEYPQNDEQARGYVHLLKELRHGLDKHQHKKGINYKFLLTVSRLRYSLICRRSLRKKRLLPLVVQTTIIVYTSQKWIDTSIFGI
jgi:Glycosyl hydrolases family 18